jgi:hypothetical protein
MGLFDGYSDSRQFVDSGGLLGRLLSLQPQPGEYQSGAGLNQAPAVPQTSATMSMSWPTNLADYGQQPSAQQSPAPDLHLQYQALRLMLCDRNAMLATVNPEIGKTLVAQALANQQPNSTANVVQAGYRLGGIPFPAMAPAPPPPPIPMPAIPDWWKAAGALLQLYPGLTLNAFGGSVLGGQDAVILNNDDDETEDSGD